MMVGRFHALNMCSLTNCTLLFPASSTLNFCFAKHLLICVLIYALICSFFLAFSIFLWPLLHNLFANHLDTVGDFDESLKVLKEALELKKDIVINADNDSKKALSLLHYNLGSLQLEYRNNLSSRTGNEVNESIENFKKARELLVDIGYTKDHTELQGIGMF